MRAGNTAAKTTHRVAVAIAVILTLAVPLALRAQFSWILVDGALVETMPDSSCVLLLTNDAQRYVDCGNGTVWDTHTGLFWLQNANCVFLIEVDEEGKANYRDAMKSAFFLQHGLCGLTDKSQLGDWRLPTAEEWEETTSAAQGLGCIPNLTDHEGDGCWSPPTIPATGFFWVRSGDYWSATTDDNPVNLDAAWVRRLHQATGGGGTDAKSLLNYVWPVRDAK